MSAKWLARFWQKITSPIFGDAPIIASTDLPGAWEYYETKEKALAKRRAEAKAEQAVKRKAAREESERLQKEKDDEEREAKSRSKLFRNIDEEDAYFAKALDEERAREARERWAKHWEDMRRNERKRKTEQHKAWMRNTRSIKELYREWLVQQKKDLDLQGCAIQHPALDILGPAWPRPHSQQGPHIHPAPEASNPSSPPQQPNWAILSQDYAINPTTNKDQRAAAMSTIHQAKSAFLTTHNFDQSTITSPEKWSSVLRGNEAEFAAHCQTIKDTVVGCVNATGRSKKFITSTTWEPMTQGVSEKKVRQLGLLGREFDGLCELFECAAEAMPRAGFVRRVRGMLGEARKHLLAW
ncbi:hypothetical protein EJ03DRAFT_367190 [Teratosphaeria nubilosa]|uniref:Uncharacterized protein n=1 Tax=Teratosphaeria nubilosa TaxID=161662 RepID=A0A6G1L2J5_9PEZI|nr:hypothetical protein EJ03DRAFT_367190 [Teratosphaeria nubilosa]